MAESGCPRLKIALFQEEVKKMNPERKIITACEQNYLSPSLKKNTQTNNTDFGDCDDDNEIQFVSTQRNQQKLIYKGRCYTLKRTNHNDK
ncbi:hypothetical protein T11_860 [Trichinella zimbabwensis]|uniref:Uncharacterized protein n=1 Tax=Trichinella zimbabwensis TaxID=268475 RepID=A0A0V1I7M0_9BILA|nr:hypothetical protein T11_860 [Trichinella zimbabwensis]